MKSIHLYDNGKKKKESNDILSSHMFVAGIYNYLFSIIHFIVPLPSENNSVGHNSLPDKVIQNFIPKVSRQSAVLSGLCCRFQMTLVTGHSNTKSHPKRSPVLQTALPYFHCEVETNFLLLVRLIPCTQHIFPLFDCWFRGRRNPKWLDGILASSTKAAMLCLMVDIPSLSKPECLHFIG
jgi:hypothetical protein